jgi:hypothetical protein
MRDVYHEFGSDLAVGSGGDLALAAGSNVTSQRVRRRLFTNPGDYIWNLDYGGGLTQFVGAPANSTDIEAVVRTQLGLEAAIATNPEPQVKVSTVDRANGYVVANIVYTDINTALPVHLHVTSS